MVVNRKPTGRASSVPAGLAWGLVAAMIMTVSGTALLALMIHREKTPFDRLGYGIMVTIILSSFVGAILSSGKIKRRRLVMCLASGVSYYAMLLILTALFFGAQYRAVGETGLLILCGSMLAAFGGIIPKSKAHQRKIRIPNG